MSVLSLDLVQTLLAERGRLMQLINRIVGNRATAEELVQDAFVNVLRALRAGGIEHTGAYLSRTATNLAINHLRHRRQGVEIDVSDDVRNVVPDTAPSPETVVIYRSEMQRLLAAIAELPPRRREVFVLHKFEGLSYDETAVRLGIARNTVMVQMVKALADLDRRLVS